MLQGYSWTLGRWWEIQSCCRWHRPLIALQFLPLVTHHSQHPRFSPCSASKALPDISSSFLSTSSLLIPHLILNLIHNGSFSLLPPCVATFFSPRFFRLPPAPIYICVWKRHEAKLMANPKLFYRIRRSFPVWRVARERSLK